MGSIEGMVDMTINLFTDIFKENEKAIYQTIQELIHEEEEKVYWYSKYERKAYEYTNSSLNFFSRVWSRVTLRKWILFIPIYGTFMYIMSLILDTDMIGFFKHLLGMV
jgi:hypothetical protein